MNFTVLQTTTQTGQLCEEIKQYQLPPIEKQEQIETLSWKTEFTW